MSTKTSARRRASYLASLSLLTLAALCGSAQAATETPDETFPASVTPAGAYAEAGVGQEVSISADGRLVAFLSDSANLSPEATAWRQAYVKDLDTGAVTLASRAEGEAGEPADEPGGAVGVERPFLSADGRYLTFESRADNLVAGVPAAAPPVNHVYRRDLQTGETSIVDRVDGSGGEVLPIEARLLAVSADGRLVAFSDLAEGLEDPTGAHPKGEETIYVRDLQTGITTEIAAEGAEEAAFSDDGRYLLFTSPATGLDPEAGGTYEVYRRDLQTGETLLVSRANPTGAAPQGEPADGEAYEAVFVGQGDCEVAFLGEGTSNLTPDGEDPARGIYLRNFCASPPSTTLLSVRQDGEPFEEATWPSATDDGRVAFEGENAFPESRHLYLRDPVTGQTTLLDRASGTDGEPANRDIDGGAKVAANGCRAVYASEAENLFGEEGRLPGGTQAFVRQLAACVKPTEEPTGGGAGPGLGGTTGGGGGASVLPASQPTHLKIVRLSRAALVLEFSGPGRAKVAIKRLTEGDRRRWKLVRAIAAASSGGGRVRVWLPHLAPGRYRIDVHLQRSQRPSLLRVLRVRGSHPHHAKAASFPR